jgi:two-component system cell cycle sensor histidine kinase/response regulator CckA
LIFTQGDQELATILVVDDEEGFRTAGAEILRRAGHTVVTAYNGVEGVARYRSSPDLFHVVLTDLQMPTMDGYQLVELVRETNSRVKIICMSGGIAKRIPANTEFLQKPFRASALCACVDKLLHES